MTMMTPWCRRDVRSWLRAPPRARFHDVIASFSHVYVWIPTTLSKSIINSNYQHGLGHVARRSFSGDCGANKVGVVCCNSPRYVHDSTVFSDETPVLDHCYTCVSVLCFVFLFPHADTTAVPTPVDLEVTDVTSTSAVLRWRLDGDSRVRSKSLSIRYAIW